MGPGSPSGQPLLHLPGPPLPSPSDVCVALRPEIHALVTEDFELAQLAVEADREASRWGGIVRSEPLDEETWVASIEPPVDAAHAGEFSIVAEGMTEAQALANLIAASRAHAQ